MKDLPLTAIVASYRCYGDVVLGMKPVNKEDIDPFEAIIQKVKAQRGIKLDNEMTVEELKQLVVLFKQAIKDQNR